MRFRRLELKGILPVGLLFAATAAPSAFAVMPPLTQWETAQPDEAGTADAMIQQLNAGLKSDYTDQGKRAFRDAHPRAQGCVTAKFTVNPNLDPMYQTGVFATPGQTYDAFVRFSSSLGPAGDSTRDARGLAIKLLGVPGTKLLDDQATATTHDFIHINNPTFPTTTASEFAAIVNLKANKNIFTFFGTNPLLRAAELKALLDMSTGNQYNGKSLLQMQYYSMVPYLLNGPNINTPVKFTTRPCAAVPDAPLDGTDNQLRNDLQARLQSGTACFEFAYQFYQPNAGFDIESGMSNWPESVAPFTVFATLTIPSQSFVTDQRLHYCDALSFQPWHALPQHQPLGNINRARKVVYEAISLYRHTVNSDTVPLVEPTDLSEWNALTDPTYTNWPAVKVPAGS